MAGILRTDTIQNSNTSTIITQTNSTTITIGTTGQTVALASGASSSGFGRSGSVNWDTTAKTTGFTSVSGNGYFCNTTSTAFTVTLPATPTAGDIVGICDYANTFATNNLTVARNGSNIAGSATNASLATNGISVTFVYVDSTQGWIVTDSGNRSDLPQPTFITATGGTITTSGNYKIHTFTGPGTFTVSSVGNPLGSTTVDYLVVAGGGGGGWDRAGGGGAGGFRESVPSPAAWTASPLASPGGSLPVSVTGYPITVGAGGPGGSPSPGPGTSGNPSVFSTITSTGGGGGKAAPGGTAGTGGSGGGAGAPGSGGSGNTPPVSPSQGNPGGNAPAVPTNSGSGGGGATVAGSDGTLRAGGAGATTSISGSPTAYAGGGGGGYSDAVGCGTGGAGGTGGGGKGGDRPMTPTNGAVAGTTNTGGGGGGGANGPNASPIANGAAGGSGIVVIRYKYQ